MKIFAEDIPVIEMLFSQGESLQEIADKYHMTLSGLRVAMKRSYYKPKHFQDRSVQEKAQKEVSKAVDCGLMVRPNKCEGCNKTKSRIIAHHDDYSKPLKVEWLCVRCHHKRHPGQHGTKYREYKPLLADKKAKDFLSQYGDIPYKMLTEYKSDLQITMTDIANVIGKTREYVRQTVRTVYGTTSKNKVKKSCIISIPITPRDTEFIDFISTFGLQLKKIGRSQYTYEESIFLKRSLNHHEPTNTYSIRHHKIPDHCKFVITSINESTYIIPTFLIPNGYIELTQLNDFTIENYVNGNLPGTFPERLRHKTQRSKKRVRFRDGERRCSKCGWLSTDKFYKNPKFYLCKDCHNESVRIRCQRNKDNGE